MYELVRNGRRGKWEVYDLAVDPMERENLVGRKGFGGELRRLVGMRSGKRRRLRGVFGGE